MRLSVAPGLDFVLSGFGFYRNRFAFGVGFGRLAVAVTPFLCFLVSRLVVLCLVARVRHTATTLLNLLCFKGVRKLSQRVRHWRHLPTAFENRSAFTRWGNRPGRAGTLVYLDLGVEAAPLKGASLGQLVI